VALSFSPETIARHGPELPVDQLDELFPGLTAPGADLLQEPGNTV
jgi:hypothetical protein